MKVNKVSIEHDWDGDGVKMTEQNDVKFTSPHKYIKNTSTNGAILRVPAVH